MLASGSEPVTFSRTDSYIGVMIDDLVAALMGVLAVAGGYFILLLSPI